MRVTVLKSIGILLCVGLALALSACESGPKSKKKKGYRVSAKEHFQKGKKAYEEEDYLEAIGYLKFVKNKFPYSSYATESDLLLADCHFGRDRFIEAADAYANFIKLHPRHARVGYAMFRIAQCYIERMPSDFFILPPSYEKDQKETIRAILELERFVARYPKDENIPEAKKLLRQCKRHMAKRSRYLMNFYMDRNKFRGALWRAQQILSQFGGVGLDEEALYIKAKASRELGDIKTAQQAATALLKRFPAGDLADDAQTLLALISPTKAPEIKKPAPSKRSKKAAGEPPKAKNKPADPADPKEPKSK